MKTNQVLSYTSLFAALLVSTSASSQELQRFVCTGTTSENRGQIIIADDRSDGQPDSITLFQKRTLGPIAATVSPSGGALVFTSVDIAQVIPNHGQIASNSLRFTIRTEGNKSNGELSEDSFKKEFTGSNPSLFSCQLKK